jgi:hypothetical protein
VAQGVRRPRHASGFEWSNVLDKPGKHSGAPSAADEDAERNGTSGRWKRPSDDR